MSVNKFKYFRDPENFAFKVEAISPCSICEAEGRWFDAGGFYGKNRIECICDDCLFNGKLKELEIETNTVLEDTSGEVDTILYKTPALPTWQEMAWPYVGGAYCVFERMASKEDFDDKEEFQNSFSDLDKERSDLDWLWEILPERRIKNHLEGNFDISVYLFTLGEKKHCIWDAN